MADLSLDEYIVRKNPNTGVKNRLGQKVTGGRGNALSIQKPNVVIQRNFDARQKLNQKSVGVRDARQRLMQRTGAGRGGGGVGGGGGGNVNNKPVTLGKVQIQNPSAQKRIPLQRMGGIKGRVQIPNTGAQGRMMPQQRPMGGPKVHVNTEQNRGKVILKRPATAPVSGPTPAKNANLGLQDMRIKIQNAQIKKMDAREKIEARQKAKMFIKNAHSAKQQQSQPQQQTVNSSPRVTMTGLLKSVKSVSGITTTGGTLQKTIGGDLYDDEYPGSPADDNLLLSETPLRKTISNAGVTPSQRMGNNIVITPTEVQQQPSFDSFHIHSHQSTPQRPATAPQPSQHQYHQPMFMESGYSTQYSQPVQQQQHPQYAESMPMIRITNDEYRPPPPPPPMPAARAQPVYQQTYYEPPALRQPEAEVVPPPARRTTVPINTTPLRPVLQERLGEVATESATSEISPLQGYRIMITNLHTVVTQDDIVELFGAVGALKKARLLRAGTAEVVFIKKEDALAAVRKYHNRELDGQPMQVVMTTSMSAAPAKSTQDPASQPLRLPSSNPGTSTEGPQAEVDVGLLHKALFKTVTKDDPPTRPVTFTVKI